MKKIVVLGRGGAGKSTIAWRLSKILNIPCIELDKYFWKEGLVSTPISEWKQIQNKLTKENSWIMDGDLGKYDSLEIRLSQADTIIILDFSLYTCLKRAIKRSPERFDFWWWLITWPWLGKPKIRQSIKNFAPNANLVIFRNQSEVEKFLNEVRGK